MFSTKQYSVKFDIGITQLVIVEFNETDKSLAAFLKKIENLTIFLEEIN